MGEGQVAEISSRATAFSVVCDRCADDEGELGWAGATFAGSLELDFEEGVFLCRRGHTIRVKRAQPADRSLSTEAA